MRTSALRLTHCLAILLMVGVNSCSAKLPDGATGSGSGSNGGGGGGNGGASLVEGVVYDAQTLQPLPGSVIQAGSQNEFADGLGAYQIAPRGASRLSVSKSGQFTTQLRLPSANLDTIQRDVALVPAPPYGSLFDGSSSTFTNRYLAGVRMGDSVVFQNSADPNVPPIEWTVVNEEYNHGIWALRFRWGEAEWADHFVLAEDIFGNIRLLEHNSVVVDMNEPPIVLPEVIADGQILIDCQGNEVKVVAVTAEIAPAPELGMPENFQACLFTERLSDGAPEVWAPGHGMVLTRKAGPGNQDYVPTSGLFAGEPLSGVLAAYHSTSWQIQHPWLPGLKVGDRLDWQGGGIHSGSQRSLEVVAQTYLPVSGIACLVLEDRIDWVNQTTLWIAEDALGNVRLLQEVRNGALRTYSPERAPVWLPALDEEGVHLGLRVGLMSAEVEHTEVEVVTTAGLGTFSSCTEIECEADGGFTKEEWFWTAGFGAVRIAHPGPGHWDLASIRLNGS